MFSRSHFEASCRAFIADHDASTLWSWSHHPKHPAYGFMSRTALLSSMSVVAADHGTVDEDADQATSPISFSYCNLISNQYVVYSATYQVPVFYFTIHDANGVPLPLSEIVNTSLFKYGIRESANSTTFALTSPTSSFPLLSQGDHPVLGTPCWYFHPCETANAVEELMRELSLEGLSESRRLVRWLEMWFLVLGSTVSL